MRKKLLIISYHYPPDPVSNPYPTYSWAKYLPDFGWEPIILASASGKVDASDVSCNPLVYRTVHNQAFKLLVDLRQKTPLSQLSFKLLNFILINFFLYPDDKRGWFTNAYKEGLSIASSYPISIILSVATPWTDHWVASALSKKLNIPWIADYRDPWTQKTSAPYRIKWFFHNSISQLIEKKIGTTATCCIHASDIWAEQLGSLLAKKVYTIPNGYDNDDFPGVSEFKPVTEQLQISYVGTLHFPQRLGTFLEGFCRFVNQSNISTQECRLNFVGTGEIALIKQRYKLLDKYINYIPYLSKEDAIKYMTHSHILLLFLNNDTGWYPTKVFEYLAAEKTILASPDNGGVINDLLLRSRSGFVSNDSEEIALWLDKKIKEFQLYKDLNLSIDKQFVKQYERRNLTARLADVLNNVC